MAANKKQMFNARVHNKAMPVQRPSITSRKKQVFEVRSSWPNSYATYSSRPTNTSASTCTAANIIPRFYRHQILMQQLVAFCAVDDDFVQFATDIECVFELPSALNHDRYVCKSIDFIDFVHLHEAVQFVLDEFWNEWFAQALYCKLVKLLTRSQKCYLMSIGVATKMRKYRFKKYDSTFRRCESVDWLQTAKIATSKADALRLTNFFCDRGLTPYLYKKDSDMFHKFDAVEIEKQCNVAASAFNFPAPTASAPTTKFTDHNKVMQNLIQMAMPKTSEHELYLHVSTAFYLPRCAARFDGFVSKTDGLRKFVNVFECVQYILTQHWCQHQPVYALLMEKLSLVQKAKLFSLGMEKTKTKTKHFKSYKACFSGSDACQWWMNKRFTTGNSLSDAIAFGQALCDHGLLMLVPVAHERHGQTSRGSSQVEFKNEQHIYYQCNVTAINQQCIAEKYACDVNISPCASSSPSFESSIDIDIDYDVNDNHKIKSLELEEEVTDAAAVAMPKRTEPIKIQNIPSKSSMSAATRSRDRSQFGAQSIRQKLAGSQTSHISYAIDLCQKKSNDSVMVMPSMTSRIEFDLVDVDDDDDDVSAELKANDDEQFDAHKDDMTSMMATRVTLPNLCDILTADIMRLKDTNSNNSMDSVSNMNAAAAESAANSPTLRSLNTRTLSAESYHSATFNVYNSFCL
eukprot:CAMPEP_0202690246 /NCGR_PEP_ID=MMETSP1385-20130828/5286_1 /ASSEMBLY_ACC=CAM_ASM_000861 /TAXON_ID=933848 /ORGANISM="Elphidium margaritaceum" /LENGTH=686 /DNA_ID=CAMNT_0049345483 /DNA_START=176 /DNA_END=2236 /DNA_ORIENTATION=+